MTKLIELKYQSIKMYVLHKIEENSRGNRENDY